MVDTSANDTPAEHRIRPEHLKRFRRACSELNAVMRRIQEYEPEANYYHQEDSLLLLVGPSHDESSEESLYANVADRVVMPGSDGGAW